MDFTHFYNLSIFLNLLIRSGQKEKTAHFHKITLFLKKVVHAGINGTSLETLNKYF